MVFELNVDIRKTCRLCLLNYEKLHSLFSDTTFSGFSENLGEIVRKCVGIEVDYNCYLPEGICDNCKRIVTNYYVFKVKCKEREKILQEYVKINFGNQKEYEDIKNDMGAMKAINMSCENSYQTLIKEESTVKESDTTEISDYWEILSAANTDIECFDIAVEDETEISHSTNQEEKEGSTYSPKNLINDEDIIPPINNYEENFFNNGTHELCPYCEQIIDEKEYIDHCRYIHFLCLECFYSFGSLEEINEHVINEHQSKVKAFKYGRKSLFCEVCNKRLSSTGQLKHHIELHKFLKIMSEYSQYFACVECSTMYLKEKDLTKHMITHSASNNLIIDDNICTDYQFLEEDKTLPKSVTCGICSITYDNNNKLKCHIILHSDTFCCPFEACGCQYNTFSRLCVHIDKKHITDANLICKHCNERSFKTYDEFQHHLRSDCPAKKFICSHCDKKFFSAKTLQIHLKGIEGKRYMCQFCGKSFAQHGELVIHNRTHTGERPFKCTICSKTYKTASMRAAHMDVHIEGKTYSCTLCDKKLQTRTSYRNHIKRHTEEKNHICSTCGKRFFTKYHLKLHTMKIHCEEKMINAC